MKYKPRHTLVVVEKIEEEIKETSGIILPNSGVGEYFIRVKIIEVGPEVKDLKPGDICLAENMIQPFSKDEKKYGLMQEKFISCIEDDGKPRKITPPLNLPEDHGSKHYC